MENYNSIEYAYKYREILKKALTDLESMKTYHTKETYNEMKNVFLSNLAKTQDTILEACLQ